MLLRFSSFIAEQKNLLDLLTAFSTAAAAVFSAISALMAKKSALAAQISADEAWRMRQEEILPRLVLEKNFLDFQFIWPDARGWSGCPAFLARKNVDDLIYTAPTFSVTNFGDRPALELEVVFELDDQSTDFSLPKEFIRVGLSLTKTPTMKEHGELDLLNFPNGSGGSNGLVLYRKEKIDVPFCAPQQTRNVEFPKGIMSRVFLRALQAWEFRQGQEFTLTISLKAYAIDGQPYQTQFRFKIVPFFQGQYNPIIVNGHCIELSMYPKSINSSAQ